MVEKVSSSIIYPPFVSWFISIAAIDPTRCILYTFTDLNGGEKDAEFKISEEFYGKKEFAWEEVAARMRNGRNINLVGNVTVEMAVKEGLVNADSVIEIEGIKHAQVYSI